jgi:hypothetical protein
VQTYCAAREVADASQRIDTELNDVWDDFGECGDHAHQGVKQAHGTDEAAKLDCLDEAEEVTLLRHAC